MLTEPLVRRINASRTSGERVELGPLLAKLEQVRAAGYARSEASIIPDTAMLAMAVSVPPGHRPLALAVGGPLERMRRGSQQILALMRRKLEALPPGRGAAERGAAAGGGAERVVRPPRAGRGGRK